MTEITQADRDAAAQYDVVEAFARHRKYGYDQGYYDGRQFDRMEAEQKIVAWLRKEAIMSTDTVRRRMNKALDQIEAGEHLK